MTIKVTSGATVTLCGFEDTFLRSMSGGAFSNSWHISFPLLIFCIARLLAAADVKPRSKLFGLATNTLY
jgi:hypothetical protein